MSGQSSSPRWEILDAMRRTPEIPGPAWGPFVR
jgi:hypothetical protein